MLFSDLKKEGRSSRFDLVTWVLKGTHYKLQTQICCFLLFWPQERGGALPGLIILEGTSPLPRLKLYKYVVSFCPEEGALESDSKLMIIGKNQVLPQFYSKLAKKFTRIYLQHFASLLWGCLVNKEPKKLAKQKLTYWTPSLLIWQEISYLIETKWDVQYSSNVAGMVIFSQRR